MKLLLLIANRNVLLLGLAGWLTFTSCENSQKDIDQWLKEEDLSVDKAKEVTFIYSEQGKTIARLRAKEFSRNEKIKPVYMDMTGGLYVEFFNDTLGVENTLNARKARYYEEAGNVLLRDSIVVVNKKGDILKTEELVWNQKLKKFYTNKFVSIQTENQKLFGEGLEASEDFSWYEIKNIRGSVLVDKTGIE